MQHSFYKILDKLSKNSNINFHIDEMGYSWEKTIKGCLKFFEEFMSEFQKEKPKIQWIPYLAFSLTWNIFNRYLNFKLDDFEPLFDFSQIPNIWIMDNKNHIKLKGEYYEREIIDKNYTYKIYYRCVLPQRNIQCWCKEYGQFFFIFAD